MLFCCFAGPWIKEYVLSVPRSEMVEELEEGREYTLDEGETSMVLPKLLEGSKKSADFRHQAKIFGTHIYIGKLVAQDIHCEKKMTRLSTKCLMNA
jgi:hypothetical protein